MAQTPVHGFANTCVEETLEFSLALICCEKDFNFCINKSLQRPFYLDEKNVVLFMGKSN